MNDYDVVVIGGGAAGLSAGLVLARARRNVAVVDAGAPRNAPAAHMHGYLGSDGLPPAVLLATGRDEVTRYGGNLVAGNVTGVKARRQPDDHGPRFDVHLDDGRSLHTRRLLVTTGLRDEIPDIPGVRDRWGRDLLHCPYCHGHEVRDLPLGVLGGTPEAPAHAQLVRQWSNDVVYFAHGTPLAADLREQLLSRAITVIDEQIAHLVIEHDQLVGVQLVTGQVVPRTAVFVRPTFVPNDYLLVSLGCATQVNGWVAADTTGATSVPGVWVAGNAANPRAQVITAAGEGSAAAIAINNDLTDEDVAVCVAESRLNFAR
jgi:thioredoxin reductase